MEQKEIIAKSIDQICDMILACDQTGRIIYMNETAQKQLEYPVSDPSISIFDIFPGIFTEAKDLAETRQKTEVDRLPVDIYRYNRTCFPVWMRLLDTGNADYICIAHDRTKVKKTRRQPKSNQNLWQISHMNCGLRSMGSWAISCPYGRSKKIPRNCRSYL